MWNWIKSWFVSNKEHLDLYHPKQRVIYHFWDGKKVVDADPMPIYKAMMTVGPELSVDLKVSNSVSKDAGKAHDAAIVKIRKIFRVKSLDEGGITEAECVQLLEHFLRPFCYRYSVSK